MNISEKKRKLIDLVTESRLFGEILPSRECDEVLAHIQALPDEIDANLVEVLDVYEGLLDFEKDESVKDSMEATTWLRELWRGLVKIREGELKDRIGIVKEEIRRLDEIKKRRTEDPNASIDDLLGPIVTVDK